MPPTIFFFLQLGRCSVQGAWHKPSLALDRHKPGHHSVLKQWT